MSSLHAPHAMLADAKPGDRLAAISIVSKGLHMSTIRSPLAALLAILAGVGLAGIAAAVPCTWTGTTSGNWRCAGGPSAGDDLVFPNGATTFAMNQDIADLSVNSLTFSGNAGGYSLTGTGNLTISGGAGITSSATKPFQMAPNQNTLALTNPLKFGSPIAMINTSTGFGGRLNLDGPIDLNGSVLSFVRDATVPQTFINGTVGMTFSHVGGTGNDVTLTVQGSSLATVTKAGSGLGTVTSNVGAINCGGTCSDTYTNGTLIVLTATPDPGNQFTGWLGPCTGTGTCNFTINGVTTAVATFAPASLGAPKLDIDGTSSCDALTDGLLIIRHLFNLSGASLISGAVGLVASRTTDTQIGGYLTDIKPILDIDGNGQADPMTDGLLIMRYLFGLRGAGLIAGAVGPDPIRSSAADIELQIQGLCANLPLNPASLALQGWWRGSYTGSPWPGTPSIGGSGTRVLSASPGDAPAVGAAQNGYSPADFDAGAFNSISTGASLSTFFAADAGSLFVLFQADIAAPAAVQVINRPPLVADNIGHISLNFSTAGVTAVIDEGTYCSASAAATAGPYHLAQMKWDGTNLMVRVDSGSWVSTPCGNISSLSSTLKMGYVFGGAVFDGRILEVGLAKEVFSDSTFDAIKTYLNSRYSLGL